jgi:hypothetical protein
MFELSLKDLLSTIDEQQHIMIQCHGDIYYTGKRMYILPSDIHSEIHVLNILVKPEYDINIPYITICVDKGFD